MSSKQSSAVSAKAAALPAGYAGSTAASWNCSTLHAVQRRAASMR